MTLLAHHQDKLAAITPEVLEAIGVYSAETEDELPAGFRGWDQATLPAMVFPWTGAGGEILIQIRPDDPVESKYLTLANSIMPLGVHPFMRDKLADPGCPILIVEGTKQWLVATSALADRDVCVIGVTGCDGWSHEGLPVPDFEHVPWTGRDIFVLFDADFASNRDVWEGARALANLLTTAYDAGTMHYVHLPARGAAGLDDLLLRVANRTEVLERMMARADTALGRAPARKPKKKKVSAYLGDSGLLVATLARDLRKLHPMALSRDRTIAVYHGGVYRIGDLPLAAAVAEALGEDYRRSHFKDAESFISGQLYGEGVLLPEHTDGPIVNVANGMLNLETAELLPHDPAHLSSQQLAVTFDPAATCPRYEAWAAEQVGSQLDDLEEVVSTMLDPSRTPSKAPFLFGPSRSGKSTYLRLMVAAVGPENVAGVTLAQLSEDRFAAANLYGKILNAAADLSAGDVNDLSLFKMLTGEDMVNANRKYGHQFIFTNRALFAFSANTIPTVSEASTAYLERIKPFRFDHSFAGFEDPSIEAGMVAELPGILNRWVTAWRRLRARSNYAATDPLVARMFTEGSNRVRRWVAEEMAVTPAAEGQVMAEDRALTRSELHRLFSWAATREDEAGMGQRKLTEHLLSVPGVVEVRRGKSKVKAINVIKKADGCPDGGDYESAGGDYGGKNGSYPATDKIPRNLNESEYSAPAGLTGNGVAGPGGESGDFNPPCPRRSISDITERDESVALGEDGQKSPLSPPGAVAVDLETASVDELWSYGSGFVRLAGHHSGGAVTITTDVATIPAGTLAGHNVWGFDLLALARYHGLDILTVKALDTKILAFLADPPPAKMNDGWIERNYSLDAVGQRLLGVGKDGDLKKLAKLHGGYDRIPLDDPEYRTYLTRDVELIPRLLECLPLTEYARREHEVARVAAQISLSGFRVDEEVLGERVAAGGAVRTEMLAKLAEYGLPTTKKDGSPCKAPQATEAGREAITKAFLDLGVELPPTKTGAPALDQDAMDWVIEDHPAARALAETIKSLNGIRSVYETVAGHLVDGRVHPMIGLRQATGRWSVQRPGLTVMGKRGGRHVEREIFLAEPGEIMIAADLAQIDARAVAALSEDRAYLELFEPGRDAHREIARMVWGDESRREDAKAIGHGWNYGMGVEGLSRNAGVAIDVAHQFDQTMRKAFPGLVRWRKEVREQARSGDLLDNGFGRKMRPDPSRSHTQGPALMGQGAARDLLMEGLLRLPKEILPMLRAVIHDEVVLSVPEDSVDEIERLVVKALSFDWKGVQVVAGLVGRGRNWGTVYAKEQG